MLIKKYKSIMQQPEEHRSRWALGLAVTCSVVIFISFAFYKGYLNFGGDMVASKNSTNNLANIVSVEVVPSPIQNTKSTFKNALEEINKQYQEFKDSLSDVFVPFITGIEVYERK